MSFLDRSMATVHPQPRSAAAQHGAGLVWLLPAVEIAALVAAIAQIMVIEIRGRNAIAQFGGATLQVADMAMPLLPLLGLLLARQRIQPPRIVLAYLAFYGFVLMRGMALDPAAALNAFRLDVTLIVLMLSISTGGIDRMGYDTVRRILLAGALLATAVSLARFAFGPNFLIVQGPIDIEITDDWNDGRTLGAPAVVLMALAIVFSMARDYALRLPKPRLRFGILSAGLLAMIAASGQRTALLGFVVALGLMAINRIRPAALLVLLAVPALLFITWTGIVSLDAAAAEDVGQGLGGRSGTFAFRTHIWHGFFQSIHNWPAIDLFFGLPLGQRPSFYVLERVWTASLHSAYVGLVPQIGFVGTGVVLLGVLAYTARAARAFLRHDRDAQAVSPELRVYLAAILLVFGISYEWRTIFGLMLGCLFLPYRRPDRVAAPREIGQEATA
jgi:hypothetical protein